ncbi:MAG: biotin carboxylase [Phycisphaerales bacterium]
MTTVNAQPSSHQPNLVKAKPLTSNVGKRKKKGTLRGISEIRRFFYRNTEPIYFISATNFNLLGIDEWVRNFTYINYIDCFDGQHPNVFVPSERPHEPFESIEDINNYLLRHPDVRAMIKNRGKDHKTNGKAVFLMFDETTEKLCKELDLEVCFPPAALREQVDDKMETTRIGNRARVHSVPNKLVSVKSYEDLRKKTSKLGDDVVIQTAYGDSGHTTFFVKDEEDFKKHEADITSAPEVKVMKRIRCRGSALEACVTRHGTIVGPLMTELVGFKELTPYRGGWCGNEVFAGAFDKRIRKNARRAAMAFGDELREMGYRGYFEIDYLTDLDTGKVYLGECNPRITGASSMTNLAAFAHADAPLFLFHLLEWMGIDYELDVDELNDRWADPQNIDSWSQLVIKHTEDSVDRITHAPPTGIYELDSKGQMHYVRMQTHRRTVQFENRAFFLRISKPGDYRYEGADLGILVSPGRFMDEDFQLTRRAKQWIKGVRSFYRGDSDFGGEAAPELTGFKLL